MFFFGKALASGRCPPTRWWFQLIFVLNKFYPEKLGEDESNLMSTYFLDGLVQPPTSLYHIKSNSNSMWKRQSHIESKFFRRVQALLRLPFLKHAPLKMGLNSSCLIREGFSPCYLGIGSIFVIKGNIQNIIRVNELIYKMGNSR